MASKPVKDAFSARLAANWSFCPIVDVNDGGSVPNDRSPFLAVQYPVGTEEQITVGAPGANVFRERGAARFILSFPAGRGTSPWDEWVESLRDLFRGKQFGGVTTWAPSPPTTDDQSDDGGFFRLSFACPYYADRFA